MSQIICEECGKSIEISVSRCPYCGCPLEAMLCNEKITTQENVADKLCKICGSKLKEGVISCSVCGWDGIHKYKRPFGDKENFDQQLFDSIQIPKKPPSAIKAFIIASVPVLALLPIGLEALWFEPVAIVVYLILRSKTKEWEWITNNFEKYRISQYNLLKEQKDKQADMQRKIRRYEHSAIKYQYAPYSYRFPVARYFVHSTSNEKVEVLLEDKNYLEIPFTEIIGSEILEDAEVRGGVGRAIVGGMIAGDAGAIVGASTAKKSVTTFTVRILSNNLKHPTYDIPLIKSEVSTDSRQYKEAIAFANDVQASIKAIVYNQKASSVTEKPVSKKNSHSIQTDVTDEIMKYKKLLDCGAITQEEFEAKKKQLLEL